MGKYSSDSDIERSSHKRRHRSSTYSHRSRRSRSHSRSRDRSKKHHKKQKRKHKRRTSSSESSESERYSKSHSNRSSADRSRMRKEKRYSREKSRSKEKENEGNLSTLFEDSALQKTDSEILAHNRLLSDIETSSFTQQSFSSSRSTKVNAVAGGKDSETFEFGTNAELSSKKGIDERLKDDTLYSPFLFGDPEEREEKFLKRIFLMRQKAAQGESV